MAKHMIPLAVSLMSLNPFATPAMPIPRLLSAAATDEKAVMKSIPVSISISNKMIYDDV